MSFFSVQVSALSGVHICYNPATGTGNYPCGSSDSICPEDYASGQSCSPFDPDCPKCRTNSDCAPPRNSPPKASPFCSTSTTKSSYNIPGTCQSSTSTCSFTTTDTNCNLQDGWYCNANPNIKEQRDYGCAGADGAAACTYAVLVGSSEDCSTKVSTDTDNSPTAYNTAGTVTDYKVCNPANPSACSSVNSADTCNGDMLTEYGASGKDIVQNAFNCKSQESTFCSPDHQFKNTFGCSGTPGACTPTGILPTGTNADGDDKDKECGDSLCDNAAGVYDTTKTATETNCADGLDNDCNGLADCADSACAGQTGLGGGKCCQTASNCLQSPCVIESCTSNTCQYSNRAQCDLTECPAGQYCNAAGGVCAVPDSDSAVCLNCAPDQTTGSWASGNHVDAGKGYGSNLFNSDGAACPAASCSKGDCHCFDANGNTVNHLGALSTGNCCGNNANEWYKSDYFGAECVVASSSCVWSTGDAQASNSGNAQWWCNVQEWNECKDPTIGTKVGGVTCAGIAGNNAWVITPLPENQYSCSDGLDNDGNGMTDCADANCAGSITGTVRDRDTSNPISLATVNANQNLNTIKSATTSQQGAYTINPLNCGIYDLSASHPNYAPQTVTINLQPRQQLTQDFSLILGTSCESDCTYAADNIIHAACDGKNGCTFFDAASKAVCDNAQPGWIRDYNSTHYVVCPSGAPQQKVEVQASVSCASGTLVKVTRIVVYNGKPVRLVVATCG